MDKKLTLNLKKVTIRQLAVRTKVRTGSDNFVSFADDGADSGTCSLNVKTAGCSGQVR